MNALDSAGVIRRLLGLDGGKGSGNFGHKGRPGKVGGSGNGGGSTESWNELSEPLTSSEHGSKILLDLPDHIDREDIPVFHGVGAKYQYQDVKVKDLRTGEFYYLVPRTSIQSVQVFAGKGTSNEYRDAWIYVEKFERKGIETDIDDWMHLKGVGVLDTEEGPRRANIHWSESDATGPVDFFVKEWIDQ